MYVPKRGFENGPEEINEYFPMRALSTLDQTFMDTMVSIDGALFGKDLGYFVSFNRYGGPRANTISNLNYPTEV